MAFLKGLFKKKPGGTFFGNLIRGVANKATGGILGTGAHMIPLGSTTETGGPSINTAAASSIIKDVVGDDPNVKKAIKEGIWAKYKIHILAAGAALTGLIVWLVRRGNKGGSGRRSNKRY